MLSCNEGMFPRRSVSASFVPAELRRGFGLPTYEYQDACDAVEKLGQLSRDVDIPSMVKMMKQIVPEFISKNSRFSEYDAK